jgi:hypothetical protein
MAEAIAIRTFIKLKVLEAIPTTGSKSLQDISKATGAQESLIGKSLSQSSRGTFEVLILYRAYGPYLG